MATSPQFWVPLSRSLVFPNGVERLRASTLAGTLITGYDLNELSGIKKFHDPKTGRVDYGFFDYSWTAGKLIERWRVRGLRLDLHPVDSVVFLELPVNRVQWTQTGKDGRRHGLAITRANLSGSICGMTVPDIGYTPLRQPAEMTVPDCPKCLEEETQWVLFSIVPYQHPRERRKATKKTQARSRESARKPDVFARLIDDAYLDPNAPPTIKPVVIHDPETFDETEDFIGTPREAKIQSRVEGSRRFEVNKLDLHQRLRAAGIMRRKGG